MSNDPRFGSEFSQQQYAHEQIPQQGRRGGGGGGRSCLSNCLIGCGVIFLLLVVLAIGVGVVLYRSTQWTQVPAEVDAIIKRTVDCTIPDGYEGKAGWEFRLMQFNMSMAFVAPKDVDAFNEKGNKGDFNTDKTVFMLFSMPNVVDEKELQQEFERQGKIDVKGKDGQHNRVEIKVGDRVIRGSKVESIQNGKKVVIYQLMPKPGLIMTAQAAADQFDQAAFESLLKSMNAGVPAKPEDEAKDKDDKPDNDKDPDEKADTKPKDEKPKNEKAKPKDSKDADKKK